MAVWYFLRAGPGDLRPLRPEDMEAFLKAEMPLPADDQRLVHYVGLEVPDGPGPVMHLGRVWFARCPVRRDGKLDQKRMLDQTNARLAVQERLEDWQPGDGVIVDARDAFTARRLQHESRWQPTDADISSLRLLVNRKAGWNIL
jgi:hypothetical protein